LHDDGLDRLLVGNRVVTAIDDTSQELLGCRGAAKGDVSHPGIGNGDQQRPEWAVHGAVSCPLARAFRKRRRFGAGTTILVEGEEEMVQPLETGQLALAITASGRVVV